MKLMWLTDLHLDRADDKSRNAFYNTLAKINADAVVVTGDISDAKFLPVHLMELSQACAPRPVNIVLGNHEFFGSCFSDVDRTVAAVCKEQENLRHLGHGEIVSLGNGSAMVGHRGWADGRAGLGVRTHVHSRDHTSIADFRGCSRGAVFGRMAELGRQSANYLRAVLPRALARHRNVWVATHVPPIYQAAHFSGGRCLPPYQPHFVNQAMGGVLFGIANSYPKNRITVLAGHTHTKCSVSFGNNITVHVGAAAPGNPKVQEIFSFCG
jgi:3',5'-cyclic-AMP phosphodiesterase